jgi:translation initiation factor IF-2
LEEEWPKTLDQAQSRQGRDQYLSDLEKYNRSSLDRYRAGQEQSHVEPKSALQEPPGFGSDKAKDEPLEPFQEIAEKRVPRPKTLSPEDIEFEKRQLLRAREKLRTRRSFDASESAVLEEEVLSGKAAKKAKKAKKREKKGRKAEGAMIPLYLPEYISVANLATALKTRLDDFTAQLKIMGFTDFSHDHVMNAEIAGLIAMEYGYEPIADTCRAEDLLPRHVTVPSS